MANLEAVKILREALNRAIDEYKAELRTERAAEMEEITAALGDWRELPHMTDVAREKHAIEGYWTLAVCDVNPRYLPDAPVAKNGMVKMLVLGVNDREGPEKHPQSVHRYREMLKRRAEEDAEAAKICR